MFHLFNPHVYFPEKNMSGALITLAISLPLHITFHCGIVQFNFFVAWACSKSLSCVLFFVVFAHACVCICLFFVFLCMWIKNLCVLLSSWMLRMYTYKIQICIMNEKKLSTLFCFDLMSITVHMIVRLFVGLFLFLFLFDYLWVVDFEIPNSLKYKCWI